VRLGPRPGERLDRTRTVSFTFRGRRIQAFEGDTIGSALYAGGQRVFSRSFKYHRRRGLLCCSGHCPNCMMTVDGVPNVRTCAEPVREGAVVRPQNVRGSLDFDLMAVTDKIGGPFTPAGFYYRVGHRPRALWPLVEKFLRNAAGLGKVDKHRGRETRYDAEHRRARVLVIGGGESGREAALSASIDGPGVVLVDESGRLGGHDLPGVEIVAPARALGIWEGGLVPVTHGELLLKYRAERIVVAAGALEQPLVFPGNDLVGVMLPGAARRLVEDWAIKPGERAVVLATDDNGLDTADVLRGAGVEVVLALRVTGENPRRITARGRKGRLRSVHVDGDRYACDLLVMSGGRQPAYSLLAQAGARVEYDERRGIFVPRDVPSGVSMTGSVTGEVGNGAVPAPSYGSVGGKCFVCHCEDVTVKDVKRALAEGFDSIELAKRYTTVTMGPCQGKLCQLNSIRLIAHEHGMGEGAIGTTTARPPWAPVEMGMLAGRDHEPCRRTAMHHRHEEAGASMMWTGSWRRPHSYGDVPGEVRAVHQDLGLIDVSTLGKIVVEGPEAGVLLDRLYPNRFSDLKLGRIRYGVLTTDGGRIMDDGTVARLGEHTYYVTTTSTGAGRVVDWLEWWNAVWGYDAEILDVTGALAAVNLAGPRAREALAPLTDLDVSNEGVSYLDAKRGTVAGVPCLVLRIGFVGELGYELHCPSSAGEHLWDTLVAAGARPFGLEPQRILRLEKQHILVGQDTDSESNLLSAGLGWMPKLDKDDFVGKWALEHVAERGVRERLVGFVMRNPVLPAEGGQIVRDGRSIGRVTSSRFSEAAGRFVGMCWVPPELAEDGSEIQIRVDGADEPALVHLQPFYDAEGAKLKS
jgi:sarcosine oxidase subunit alpha